MIQLQGQKLARISFHAVGKCWRALFCWSYDQRSFRRRVFSETDTPMLAINSDLLNTTVVLFTRISLHLPQTLLLDSSSRAPLPFHAPSRRTIRPSHRTFSPFAMCTHLLASSHRQRHPVCVNGMTVRRTIRTARCVDPEAVMYCGYSASPSGSTIFPRLSALRFTAT